MCVYVRAYTSVYVHALTITARTRALCARTDASTYVHPFRRCVYVVAYVVFQRVDPLRRYLSAYLALPKPAALLLPDIAARVRIYALRARARDNATSTRVK